MATASRLRTARIRALPTLWIAATLLHKTRLLPAWHDFDGVVCCAFASYSALGSHLHMHARTRMIARVCTRLCAPKHTPQIQMSVCQLPDTVWFFFLVFIIKLLNPIRATVMRRLHWSHRTHVRAYLYMYGRLQVTLGILQFPVVEC